MQLLHCAEHVIRHEPLDEARAALLVGGPRTGGSRLTGQVLAAEHTLRHRRPDDLRDSELLGGRNDLPLDDAPQRRVLGLVRNELDAEVPGQRVPGAQLLGRPLAHADVERLALPDDVGKGLHRLFQRGFVVVPVRLVEVDVVGSEPLERAVDAVHDVLARQTRVIGAARPDGPVDLREDLERLPTLALQRLAENLLGDRVRVHVGGVEARNAEVQCSVNCRDGCVVFDLRAVGDPVAVGDLCDFEAAVAEIAIVDHCSTLSPRRDSGAGP